ncbi:hypothetical protein INT45_008683 [Circinella minor]|uniref:J domain-containing protein n=1 Tax=Circinella minor TaxID=1195481 RepID=A0A8H7VKS0_9FUNG|nr:hypothetical protein INT45_008683 [Circinella minor]
MSSKQIDAEVNYYELLGVQVEATPKEIKKAYRLKALELHPDKNPSPDAGALFHTISQAYEVLLDDKAKASYDNVLKARLERVKKKTQMDSKRRAAQTELEERENQAKKAKMEQDQAEAKYYAELARIRAEGAKRREEWREQEMKAAEEEKIPEPTELDCALKIKWKRKKHTFTEEELEKLLNPIGKVDTIAIAEKKKGTALVVFKTVVDAHAVLTSKGTHPSLEPFEVIDWYTGKEPAMVTRMNEDRKRMQEAKKRADELASFGSPSLGKPLFASSNDNNGGGQSSFFKNLKIPSAKSSFSNAPSLSDKEYEAMTLMKLRQAERERMLEQIKREEA